MRASRRNNIFSFSSPSSHRLRQNHCFSICGTVWLLFKMIAFTTAFLGHLNCREDSSVLTIWVDSLTPIVDLSSNCRGATKNKDRWMPKHSLCTTHVHATKTTFSKGSFFSPISVLYASGAETDAQPPTNSTPVVLSVFSKTPSKVFRGLLEGSTTIATGLLGLEDICNNGDWDELKEIIDDGDLTMEELRDLYDAAVVDGKEGLDLEGFKKFYKSIDDLFDDDDDKDADENEQSLRAENLEKADVTDYTAVESSGTDSDIDSGIVIDNDNIRFKRDLVSYIKEVQNRPCNSEDGTLSVGERRPWGLDCSDRERKKLSVLIEDVLARSNSNILGGSSNGRHMSAKDLTKHILGTWDLCYTSSRTMIINKSLSGLGRSTSDMARNLGLQMTLSGNYYYGKAEFVETFGSGVVEEIGSDDERDAVLVEATVTGEWILETGAGMDYKTGLPSVSLRVEVETIAYGPNKNDADQWDSLSPIKLVDILYLDDDLMILRGNANVAALFVYTRNL